MGNSSIVRNIVELTEMSADGDRRILTMCYNSKVYGRPSEKNLENFVVAYIRSLSPGGVNEHLFKGKAIPNYSKAKIRNQISGKVVEWNAPMFFCI